MAESLLISDSSSFYLFIFNSSLTIGAEEMETNLSQNRDSITVTAKTNQIFIGVPSLGDKNYLRNFCENNLPWHGKQ